MHTINLRRVLKRGKYKSDDGLYTVTRKNQQWELEVLNKPELTCFVANLKEARAKIQELAST